MSRLSEVPEPRWSKVEADPDSLAEHVEAVLMGLTANLTQILAHRPTEPATGDHVHDIPLDAWRRAIDQWCRSPFVRRHYPEDLVAGLAEALKAFDDEDLRVFLTSLL
jgi:hypothetical protein